MLNIIKIPRLKPTHPDPNILGKFGILISQYFTIGACIALAYYAIHLISWPNTPAFNLAASSLSVFISTLTSAAFLVFYYFKRENLFLIIALMAAGATVLVIQELLPYLYSENTQMSHQRDVPKNHNHNSHISHIFISLMMALGCFQQKIHVAYETEKTNTRNVILLTSGIFLLVTLIGQNFLNKSNDHELVNIITDAAAIVPILLLGGSFLFLILKSTNGPQTIQFWLVFYIAANIYLHISSFEHFLNIAPINVTKAGLYTIGAYLILLSGLIYNSLWIISAETHTREKLTQKNKVIELLYVGNLIISESKNFEKATIQCLDQLTEFGNWDLVHVYFLNNDDDSFRHYWGGNKHKECENFKTISEQLNIEFGVGFTGNIWETKKYSCIPDITRSTEFLRKSQALEAGMQTVFAFPITVDKRLIALIELYAKEITTVDEGFISTTNSLCGQLENLYRKEKTLFKLTAREKLLNELFESFPAAMATFDEDDHLTIFNKKFKELNAGFGLEIQKNMDFSDLITTAAYSGHITDAYGREQEWIEQRLFQHKQGFSARDRQMNNGTFVRVEEIRLQSSGTVCIWTDVTELKENETKNAYMMGMLKTALSSFPGGICIFDANMKIATYNLNLIDLLELSRLDITEGTNFTDFLSVFRRNQNLYNDFISQLSSLHAKIVRTRKPQFDPMIKIGQKTLSLYAAPIQKGGFVLSLMDVTDTQNYQNNLRLERNDAESANQAKSDFVATISHEFRTPMSSIMTAVDLLRDTNVSNKQSSHLNAIKTSAQSLMHIMHDILDLSKMETHDLTLDPLPFSMDDFIYRLQNNWSYQAAAKDLVLIIKRDPDLVDVISCDGDRLHQILDKLIGNAIKFTSAGTVTVSISQIENEKIEDDYTCLKFEISDTGEGISEKRQKIISDKFTQVDTSVAKRHGGSGIGIALARDLVKLMGGKLAVSSQLGVGTSFWFELDVPLSNWENLKKYRRQTKSNYSREYTGPVLNVLVAEDHPVNQIVTQDLLKTLGHEVDIVENGEQAVAAAATCKYDIILMDIQMPEMNGYTATMEIRKLPGHVSKIPIIALTANTMYGEQKRCLDAGMDEYMSKPLEKWRLIDILQIFGSSNINNKNHWKPARKISNGRSHPKSSKSLTMDFDTFQKLNATFGEGAVENLSEKMLLQYDEQRQRIAEYIQTENWQEIGREAKILKSCFAQFGLKNASVEAAKLDVFYKQKNMEKIIELAPGMLDRCDAAIAELKSQMSKH